MCLQVGIIATKNKRAEKLTDLAGEVLLELLMLDSIPQCNAKSSVKVSHLCSWFLLYRCLFIDSVLCTIGCQLQPAVHEGMPCSSSIM